MDYKQKYLKYKQKYLELQRYQLRGGGDVDEEESSNLNCKSKEINPKECNDREDYKKQAEIFKKSNNTDCEEDANRKRKELLEMCKDKRSITIDTDSDEEFFFKKDEPPSTNDKKDELEVKPEPEVIESKEVETETTEVSLGGNEIPYKSFPLMTPELFKKNPHYSPSLIKS